MAAGADRMPGPNREALLGLAWTLVRTDFKVRYHGTIGGFVWALLKPLAMFALLLGVFSFVFGADPDYRLNLIIGLFLYEFFGDATKTGLASLATRGFLLTRAKCPAWILVLTSLANAVLTLAVFSVIIVIFLVASGRPPSLVALVQYAAYTGAFIVIVAGFSLAASVVFLRYRDLNQVWDVAAHAGFFLAPVVYPLGILPEWLHAYLYIWPPTPVIEFARAVLVRGDVPTLTAHLYLVGAAVLSLGVGTLVHRRYGPRAAEYL
ncbi:MAG TPA: ABC transporter permease [Vicinamibacterales bacterium]|nr:ABC transporter permease [Vicinamibacterales bacterium]